METTALQQRLSRGETIEHADLSAIDWEDLNAEDARFSACLVRTASFRNTRLNGAVFTRCQLPHARFTHADLRGALFEDCVLIDRADGTEGSHFVSSELRDARFLRCDLAFATFERCDLNAVEMTTCNLLGARFAKSDFSRAIGKKITTKATFHGCNLGLADLAGLRLPSCDFSGSNLREASLDETDLTGANLQDCDLFGASLDRAKLDHADLRGAALGTLNLLRLASFNRLMITADQQHLLLSALGIEVSA